MNNIPLPLMSFLNYMETIKGKSKSTVKEYFYDLRTFFRYLKVQRGLVPKTAEFERIRIDDVDIDLIKSVTLNDLYGFISYVSFTRNNSNSAKARKVSTLRSFFKFLHTKMKMIDENPTDELETPKTPSRHPVHLTLMEARELLDAVEGEFRDRDYCILTLFLNCGLRLSELVGINISNIRGDTLTVIGKGDKERTVYLNDACLKAIEDYLRVRPRDSIKDRDALFLSKRRQRISNKTVQHLVKKYVEKAGLDSDRYSAHKLRHTAATLMYKHGNVDIRALQQILGHSSISTTQIYTHVDNKRLRDAIKKNPLAREKKGDFSDDE
ncbi:MAG: tyrosine recombinase XerC [Bacillota bacterium]|nr:tyrosine recombinase XerC [Bacillota bacterium]MDD3297264.1 tyrosine recombinase XerC [Bacillota bacterium]MDD3850472.1 tyrosine recombinase XerC [Bacillota bacterium]MDD4708035.1 tyrosine recombinase XerC [Bacillota bacterium]